MSQQNVDVAPAEDTRSPSEEELKVLISDGVGPFARDVLRWLPRGWAPFRVDEVSEQLKVYPLWLERRAYKIVFALCPDAKAYWVHTPDQPEEVTRMARNVMPEMPEKYNNLVVNANGHWGLAITVAE